MRVFRMSKIIGKISRLPKTLYEHKKKTIFFGFLGYLGADWVYRWDRNQGIRKYYANLALKFGEKTVSRECFVKLINEQIKEVFKKSEIRKSNS